MFERFGDGLVGVAGGSRELCDDDTGGGGGDVCAVCMETISVVDATGQQGSSIPYHHFIPSSFSFRFIRSRSGLEAVGLPGVYVESSTVMV